MSAEGYHTLGNLLTLSRPLGVWDHRSIIILLWLGHFNFSLSLSL